MRKNECGKKSAYPKNNYSENNIEGGLTSPMTQSFKTQRFINPHWAIAP
jgi:hypothetical protein